MDELSFYLGRRVLVTGHTGFKGAWLTLWLRELGARVAGYACDVPTQPSLFEVLRLSDDVDHHTGDVRDAERLAWVVQREQPEVVFHLAAQALVRRSAEEPRATFETNVLGTVNLLEAVRQTPGTRVLVGVTSDKCYANGDNGGEFHEGDALGGADPYSASKGCAELVLAAYRRSFFAPERFAEHRVAVATARAGNVIGGGDWAADRLVPDCIRALTQGQPIQVRRPRAVRPWQHVLEPLAGYLVLGARLARQPRRYATAWNFGPRPEAAWPVAEVVGEVIRLWGDGHWHEAPTAGEAAPEVEALRLCSDRAREHLPWRPQWDLPAALARTVAWYRAFHWGASGSRLRGLCLRQIRAYEKRWMAGAEPSKPQLGRPGRVDTSLKR
jgi:CDP-glucose 4,6-dehydratase